MFINCVLVLYQIILCFDFDSYNIHTNIIIVMVLNHITEKKCWCSCIKYNYI